MAQHNGGFPSWNKWAYEMTEDQRVYEQHRVLYSISSRLDEHDRCISDLQNRVKRIEDYARSYGPRRKGKIRELLREYAIQMVIGVFIAAFFIAKWASKFF